MIEMPPFYEIKSARTYVGIYLICTALVSLQTQKPYWLFTIQTQVP